MVVVHFLFTYIYIYQKYFVMLGWAFVCGWMRSFSRGLSTIFSRDMMFLWTLVLRTSQLQNYLKVQLFIQQYLMGQDSQIVYISIYIYFFLILPTVCYVRCSPIHDLSKKMLFLSQLRRARSVPRTGVLAGAAVWRTCGECPLRSDCPLPNAERYHGSVCDQPKDYTEMRSEVPKDGNIPRSQLVKRW